MTRHEWQSRHAFAEFAESLSITTEDIMAVNYDPDAKRYTAVFTDGIADTPKDEWPSMTVFACTLHRDADDILVAGPRRDTGTLADVMPDLLP